MRNTYKDIMDEDPHHLLVVNHMHIISDRAGWCAQTVV